MWPIKPKVLTIWPFKEDVCQPLPYINKSYFHTKTCTLTFIFPLFPLPQTVNHPNVLPVVNGLTNYMWYIKNNEILLSNKKE